MKATVKQWFGSSKDSHLAEYRHFKTIKEAKKVMEREERYIRCHVHITSGSDFYWEIIK